MKMTLQQKLQKAKEYLGKKWVHHPEYDAGKNPAHRFYGSYVMAQIARKAIQEGRIL